MKKIYISLFIGIGLVLATKSGYAKLSHSTAKKHVHVTAKHSKVALKGIVKAKKKKPSSVLSSHRHHHKKNSHQIVTVHKMKKPLFKGNENNLLSSINEDSGPHLESSGVNRIHSLIVPQNDKLLEESSQELSQHHFFSVRGIVNSSLKAAGQKAGLSNDLITQLTNIFAWDIDFASDLRHGDQFTVIYDNTGPSSSHIVAAEFVTRGKTITAIRYKDSEGQVNYYSPEGKLMRKAFLSAPVDFVRISSGYDLHRKHPVLNRIRAHKGVDYAARTGTPVKAAGDGKVSFLGRKGGYGQVLILEHGEHYETLYAHLSNYKRGLHSGDKVRQGQVIGYVGQTGLATGPHLHYEFRVDGVHQNPEKLNRQHSAPLSGYKLALFKSRSQPLMAQLYQAKARSLLAKTGGTPLN